MKLKALVFTLVFFQSSLAIAKFSAFSQDIGDTALRLAIAHFAPENKTQTSFFSKRHLHMVEFLKQMPKEANLGDYPIYNSEERYKTLQIETSDKEEFSSWRSLLGKRYENCARGTKLTTETNNYSINAKFHTTFVESFFPKILGAELNCLKEIKVLFTNLGLEELRLTDYKDSNEQFRGVLSFISSQSQDLLWVKGLLKAQPHLYKIATRMDPKPLSRQIDFYENQIKLINNGLPKGFEDKVVLKLQKRTQSHGSLSIVDSFVIGTPTYPGPKFTYEIKESL